MICDSGSELNNANAIAEIIAANLEAAFIIILEVT
jgi:flavodoxin